MKIADLKKALMDLLSKKIEVENEKEEAKPKEEKVKDLLEDYDIEELKLEDLFPKKKAIIYYPEEENKKLKKLQTSPDGGDLNKILGGFDPWEK